uniref:Methyltransf_11 domain-containing protein n=1 Tax=Loa loa TaxID=7209 RepID=A0A1I7V567_LOALO
VLDAKLLPFNNEFFDKIFHVHSPYFWTSDLPAALAEMIRVLKPGGVFLSGMHLKKLEFLEKGKLIRRRQFDPTRYIFELEPAGFEDVRMEYVKGMTNKEYQLIFAKKPLEIRELRDPDKVAIYLKNKIMKEYIIERGIDEGHSLVEIQQEFLDDETYDDVNATYWSSLYCAVSRCFESLATVKDGNADLDDSLFTTGTDEHGLKIQQTATAAGCDPQSYCDNMSDKFKDLFCAFGIQPNDFIRTTETRHKEVVKHIWEELDKRGQIQQGKHEGWYSTTDEWFLCQR